MSEVISVKLGYSQCHFPHRSVVENIEFAKENGFDFMEGYIWDVFPVLEENPESLTEALLQTGMGLTIHHGLVLPENTEKADLFRRSIDVIYDWVKQGGPLNILSFDTWVDREKSFPLLLEVLEKFADTNVFILTEDCPVSKNHLKLWEPVTAYKNFGLLLDLGHMNVRLTDTGKNPTWCLRHEGDSAPSPMGDNSPEAFYHTLCNKDFPIYQLHVHNNDGYHDLHRSIKDGTADYEGIVSALKRIGFDGWVDLEFNPGLPEVVGEAADQKLLAEAAYWNKIWNTEETI